jgi:hypothetical protein
MVLPVRILIVYNGRIHIRGKEKRPCWYGTVKSSNIKDASNRMVIISDYKLEEKVEEKVFM